METGIVVGIHGAFVADVEDGRETALRAVQIRVAGNGTISPRHAREFAADVVAAADRAAHRNSARGLARECLPALAGASTHLPGEEDL
jgi:hypothetical protein